MLFRCSWSLAPGLETEMGSPSAHWLGVRALEEGAEAGLPINPNCILRLLRLRVGVLRLLWSFYKLTINCFLQD